MTPIDTAPVDTAPHGAAARDSLPLDTPPADPSIADAPVAAPGARRAVPFRWFATVVLTTVALDQLTKHLVIGWLAPGERWPGAGAAIARWFTFTHVHNTGMAFGLGQGRSAWFAVVASVVVVGLAVYQSHLPAEARLLRLAIGLQVGGAIGNLIDRLRHGYVTDFFDFQVFPVFNVADSAISIGVAVLAWHLWRAAPAEAAEAAAAPPADPTPAPTPAGIAPPAER